MSADILVDLRIWGKERGLPSPYPLLWHLVDTAVVAGALWDLYLTQGQRRFIAGGLGVEEDHAKLLVMLWAGLHDIGKATPGFQMQCPQAFASIRADPAYGREVGSRNLGHDRASQLSLVRLLRPDGRAAGSPRSGQIGYRVAQMLGGHHGRFRQATARDSGIGQLGGGDWAVQREAMLRTLAETIGNPALPGRIDANVAVLLTGLVILADWLASQEHFLRRQLPAVPVESSRQAVAAYATGVRRKAVGLLEEAGLGTPRLRQASFEETFSFKPNALQRSIRDELLPQIDGPGLLIVTAATGDGKTEAAMLAMRALADRSGASGFYFALPTMATADQMYMRVRRFIARLADGSTAAMLLHSMSWLNTAYQGAFTDDSHGGEVASNDPEALVVAPDWLKGRKRGLLAGLCVGTIDQALMAVLTTRHNALRLLGLSGKVFIVDEAHAYDDYMRAVLCKLLTWLGSMGCSAILLSATLPASQVEKLTAAYRRGAGATVPPSAAVPYPGWVFVPARPECPRTTISTEAQATVVAGRQIELRIDVRPVHHRWDTESEACDPRDRRTVLANVLAPLVEDRGCAAVICNTVDDAQRTYEALRAWVGRRAEVSLLHSRFPAVQREEITRRIVTRMGKDDTDRPRNAIVVATQVIEQSLDLDFDLVVSDLAPLAQLLQRAGRCHRHRHDRLNIADEYRKGRSEWAARPRLVVLEPQRDGGYAKPGHWGDVYHDYLLRATHLRLVGVEHFRVPEDVQEHMEAVYGPPDVADPRLEAEYSDFRVDEMVEHQVADLWTVPDPGSLGDLCLLSEGEIVDGRAATRLGADSVRVLCCYLDGEGRQWLDPERTRPLPHRGSRPDGRFYSDEIRSILGLSIPVRESLVSRYQPDVELPTRWEKTPWLGELRPLWFVLGADGPEPIEIEGRLVGLHPDLGLLLR